MPNKSLTIMTLNAGRCLLPQTHEFLQDLNLMAYPPGVIFLQDFPFRDLALLERWPHVTFAPMTKHLINGKRAVVGIAIASRYFMTDIVHCTTHGDGKLKDLQGVNDKNERIAPTVENDQLISSTEDRVAICATIIVENNGMANSKFNVATTHGAWVRGGVVNDMQRASTKKLRDFLVREGERRDGLLVSGDMNFGRGSEMYKLFVRDGLCGGFTPRIPLTIDNTLDPDHRFVKRGGRVVNDWFFDLNRHDRAYDVSDVRLRSGVSDHCALSGVVTQDYAL